jgi:hypothetical protein
MRRAAGPISTPRREAPKSSGTPIMRMAVTTRAGEGDEKRAGVMKRNQRVMNRSIGESIVHRSLDGYAPNV